MAPSQETIGMEFRIESHERLGLDELLGESIPFVLGAIAKHDMIGLAHRGHLANPPIESGIGAIEREFLNFDGTHIRSSKKDFSFLSPTIIPQ